MMKQIASMLLVLVLAVTLGGCPVEKDTLRSLAASKGVIEKEMGKHGECNSSLPSVPHTQICDALGRAIPAQHAAVLLLDTYCSSTDYLTNGGKCTPPTDPAAKKDLQVKLTSAVNNLQPLIDSLKIVAGGKQ